MILPLLATLMLAGPVACGGGSSSSTTTHTSQASEFATPYHQATAQLQNISKEVGAAIERAPHLSDAQLAQEFHTFAARWQEQLSSLESLTAPAALAVGYNTLKDAVSRVEGDLNSVVTASETHSKTAGEQAGASLVTDVLAAKSASEKLDQQLSGTSTHSSGQG
jgi:hypothetical protein